MLKSNHEKRSHQSFAYEKFQERFQFIFNEKRLLKQAFTHSSYVNEHHYRPHEDNERLEFLGDAVLELTISKYLYTYYPKMNEGELTKLRAAIVCEPSLVAFANELSFGEFILLGKGEEEMGGRERPALLADVFEAFVGALYLDQGLEAVDDFLKNNVYPKIQEGAFSHVMDYKSRLQEMIQRNRVDSIRYEIVEEKGPAHNKKFVSELTLNEATIASGVGRSKKEAEQWAAKKAIDKLRADKS